MKPVIKLEDIHKTYQTGEVEVKAVRGVSLEIFQGEFVALMGASGSGKSTMMNTLGCLDRPTSGKYFLDGIDVSLLNRDELADIRNQKIGFVFQGFNLLSRTSALENVELPMLYMRERLDGASQRDRALKALETVGLGERADHMPNQLSGGQQQRVARAAVAPPRRSASGWGRCPQGSRTRTATVASAPGPCRGCRSPVRSRRRKCGRWPPPADAPGPRDKGRGPCRWRSARGRQNRFPAELIPTLGSSRGVRFPRGLTEEQWRILFGTVFLSTPTFAG